MLFWLFCQRNQIVQAELSPLLGALQHVEEIGLKLPGCNAPPHERQWPPLDV
jgi:hypothetical protein